MKDLFSAILFFSCYISICPSMIARADSPIFVGVIEDVQPGNLSPAMSNVHVRIAFQKKDSAWIPMKSDFDTLQSLAQADRYYPLTVTWTVVFDGKRIGTITSRSSGQLHSYGDVGTQIITTSATNIPKISAGASNFSYTAGLRARTRPLLLVSAPNFKDPDDWKPTTLSAAEKSLAIKEFRKRFPSLEQCNKPEEEPVHMVPYSDDEILFINAYRSKNGEVIFGQRLDETRSRCEFWNDDHFFDYWFALTNQNVRLLGSQMTPVDAADLDNSGKSEWIFQTSRGEDEDGYELFYDDFSKKASFHWTYH